MLETPPEGTQIEPEEDGPSRRRPSHPPQPALSASWSELPAGARFGKYEIVSTLQKGGMGEVLIANVADEHGKKSPVVLKRLLADLLEDEKYVRMFMLEAQVMSRLNHPNIVKVFDMPM